MNPAITIIEEMEKDLVQITKDRDEWRELAKKLVPALGYELTGLPAVNPRFYTGSDYWHEANEMWEKKLNDG